MLYLHVSAAHQVCVVDRQMPVYSFSVLRVHAELYQGIPKT